MTKFYMVTVDGQGASTKRYEDILLARREAERLTAKEGRPAHLLEAIETVVPPPGIWTRTTEKAVAP